MPLNCAFGNDVLKVNSMFCVFCHTYIKEYVTSHFNTRQPKVHLDKGPKA